MVIISKIRYCGEPRIKLEFDFSQRTKDKIKNLPTAKFSYTLKAWHIAYCKEEYNALLGLDLIIQKENITKTKTNFHSCKSYRNPKQKTIVTKPSTNSDLIKFKEIIKTKPVIEIEFHSPKLHLKLNYNKELVGYIRTLKTSYWNNKLKRWIAKACIENLESLQNRFNYWNEVDYKTIFELISLLNDSKVVEIYRTPDNPNCIWIKLKGYKIDTDFLKYIDKTNYDKRFKRWSIPYQDSLIKRITEHYKSTGAKIVNRLPLNDKVYNKQYISNGDKQKALLAKIDNQYLQIITDYSDVLIAQRYSWNTINLYTGAILKFMNSYGSINNATSLKINKYLAEKSAQKVSDSSLNIIINAIKFYFTKVIFKPDFQIDRIKRPRKARRFPTILSKQEVERILKSLDNLKHITILFTLYSSGMRLGEILNLKVNDISFERNQIFIHDGKGKKDRVVMLSSSLKDILVLYTDKYKPIYWLFESINKKNQYSESSVRSIVKSATTKAGITKRVTPHTLRHCFATHLMDSGTQINYIQELLGHKDIKTTLLYTHLTTRNMSSIQSPIDNLDLDINKL